MAGSDVDGKTETKNWILKNNIKTILDIGPGQGTYANLLSDVDLDKIDGVEIWEPYLERFDLVNKYTNIFIKDVRDWTDFDYDLVIFGDVLEHMTKEESIAVWERTSKLARHAIISIPIVHYPQDAWEGNPYEEHIKDDWSSSEVLETFSNIVEHEEYTNIGVFYATF
jgi:hypothetical protein